jgi:hypothetical protein
MLHIIARFPHGLKACLVTARTGNDGYYEPYDDDVDPGLSTARRSAPTAGLYWRSFAGIDEGVTSPGNCHLMTDGKTFGGR